jgi:hypothetical protein
VRFLLKNEIGGTAVYVKILLRLSTVQYLLTLNNSIFVYFQETLPDLFKRIQNEVWWKQPKEEKPNLRSMLLYLNEILKAKQIDSYESACNYVVEIFRYKILFLCIF